MKKHHRKSRWWNFESMCALFVLCICITTLHLCYMRMHSFSANQKGIIFSCTLLPGEIFTQIVSNEIILCNKTKQYWITNDTQQEIALCIPLSLTVSYRWSSCEGYSSLYHSPTQHTKFQRWNSPERRRKIDVQSKNLMCWSIWSFNIRTPLPLGILTYEDCFAQIPNLIIPFHFPTSAVQGQPSNAKGLPNGDGDVEAPNWLGHKYWNIHFIYPVSVDGEYTLHKTRLSRSMVLYFIY